MYQKIILIFVVLFFSLGSGSAHAQVIINEFVSDPTSGPEWIEFLNTSSSSVDLNGWTWTELASPGGEAEHEGSPKGLSGSIPAGEVYVVEMNSALNNSGDSIGLYQGADLKDRVTFGKVNSYSKDLDAPSKGKSGAFINGNWLVDQNPTKGELNPNTASGSGDVPVDENYFDSSSINNTPQTKEENIALQKTRVQITGKSLVSVGIPFSLEGEAFGTKGETLYSGRYYWNFGDGDSRETVASNIDRFEHTYFYPGSYNIVLEHYPDFFADIPDATEKLTVRVVAPEISISSVGNSEDFFIELANNSDYSVDLSNWFLLSEQKSFLIPRGTTLSANSKVIISPKISHFSIEDKEGLRLMNSEGDLIFTYQPSIMLAHKTNNQAVQNAVSNEVENVQDISLNLGASAIDSDILGKNGYFSSLTITIAASVFIVISAGAAYFVRRKRVVSEAGEDFEILDE